MVLVTAGVNQASLLTFIAPLVVTVVLTAAPLDTWTAAAPPLAPLTSVLIIVPPEVMRALPFEPTVTSIARPLFMTRVK